MPLTVNGKLCLCGLSKKAMLNMLRTESFLLVSCKNLKLLESRATSFSDDDLTFVLSVSWEHYITDCLYMPHEALVKYGLQK